MGEAGTGNLTIAGAGGSGLRNTPNIGVYDVSFGWQIAWCPYWAVSSGVFGSVTGSSGNDSEPPIEFGCSAIG